MMKVLIVLALLFQISCERVKTIENSSSYIFAWTKDENGWDSEFLAVINANPKDTADHPGGVWTLPPNYRLKETDKEKRNQLKKTLPSIVFSITFPLVASMFSF